MDTFLALLHGFEVALQPLNLFWAAVGVTLGTAVGVLPGIGPSVAIALLLPITGGLDPTPAFIMFAGVYYGAQYGGSTASILLNTPGESGAMMTALDGHAMARKGRAAQALATAAIGSFVAGTIATIGLTLVAPLLVDLALLLGAPEYFGLIVLALAVITTILGNSLSLGFISLFLGLLIGCVGLDPQTGQARFSFGAMELLDGIDTVILAIGLFAVSEILFAASRARYHTEELYRLAGSLWMSAQDWSRSWRSWLRGTAIGFPLGALPAGGSELPTILSYTLERRLSPHKEEFGNGAIEGVAGPEAANNASAAGAIAPLLALGLPTSATAAMLLAGFQQFGIRPGPLLFETNASLVWGLIASLYISNVLLLVLNLPMVGLWVRLLTLPRPLLFGGIVAFASLGAYTLNYNTFDLALLFLFGLLGFVMRVVNAPVIPAILGLILGPLLEQHLRRSLAIGEGSPMILFERPISCTLILLAIVVVLSPLAVRIWSARADRRASTGAA
ncbi:tripartite tricarboxylate transporter permease [Ancylobacter oerskovii]|uniref:Tripartite tricarboxylate transporter permease n=1 Tax=Ancylobacter oerskovii TaxID=459519 RepID=A0ABW4YZD2_9HYPH|nr:tripartite tricarboxylate transporter permease [Ancylobacter oerskovii]MBS7543827.1 tripartite tricarboxylate transporter permease [Ancylobacter oerskovii]